MHLYPLLLFAIIVLSLLFLVMTGTGLYSAVVDSQTRNREARAALSYLAARVHAADAAGAVSVGEGPEGAALLRELVGRSGGRPQILVGAGVNADVIRALQPMTGADAFHLSAKRTENSRMTYRREGVPMGLPGISEFEVWRCDEAAVRAARCALDALCGAE